MSGNAGIQASIFGNGNVVANEWDLTVLPKQPYGGSIGNTRGMLHCHGAGTDAETVGASEMLGDTVSLGMAEQFPAVGMDEGLVGTTPNGINGWANPTVMSRYTSAKGYLTATVKTKAAPIFLQGGSMGGLDPLVWAAHNPTLVEAIFVNRPALNLTGFYNQNALGLGNITAMTHSSTTVTATTTNSTAAMWVGQEIIVAGATGLTNVNGTWYVAALTTNTVQFVVTSTPTGTYNANTATINGPAWNTQINLAYGYASGATGTMTQTDAVYTGGTIQAARDPYYMAANGNAALWNPWPIIVWYGGLDEFVNPAWVTTWAANVNAAGGNVTLVEAPTGTHETTAGILWLAGDLAAPISLFKSLN